MDSHSEQRMYIEGNEDKAKFIFIKSESILSWYVASTTLKNQRTIVASETLTYLTRPMVCDLAPSFGPVKSIFWVEMKVFPRAPCPYRAHIMRSIIWVEKKVLLRACCPHRVHRVVLQHYQCVWAIFVILDQRPLLPDYVLLPCPCLFIGNKFIVQIEALAPGGRIASRKVMTRKMFDEMHGWWSGRLLSPALLRSRDEGWARSSQNLLTVWRRPSWVDQAAVTGVGSRRGFEAWDCKGDKHLPFPITLPLSATQVNPRSDSWGKKRRKSEERRTHWSSRVTVTQQPPFLIRADTPKSAIWQQFPHFFSFPPRVFFSS